MNNQLRAQILEALKDGPLALGELQRRVGYDEPTERRYAMLPTLWLMKRDGEISHDVVAGPAGQDVISSLIVETTA